MRTILALLALLLGGAPPARGDLPPVRHVFVIVLENSDQATSFGPGSPAPYLAKTLPSQGELLPDYYGVAHHSFPNYIAMVSGQGANVLSQADCQIYSDVVPGVTGPDGQALGLGCVYPAWVKTIADQVSARTYAEDMRTPCRHPVLGHRDQMQAARVGDQYATRHNPFVYFHSLLDTGACARDDVPLSQLAADLKSDTPAFSLIVPNLCHDGHDSPCVDGEPGGLKSADAELRKLVPEITASRAYKNGGLIVVTFDESDSGAQSCCGEPQFPGTPNNGGLTALGRGGGKVGAVLLSPYIKPGTVNPTPYNHFSLLRSVEDLFGVGHLGYAAQAGLRPFGDDVFNGQRCIEEPLPAPRHGRYARGTLIASARVRGRTVVVAVAHAAGARVKLGRRTIAARRVRACTSYAFRLPRRGHGIVLIRLRARGGTEQRRLRF
jgi:phosphatidylinositol-3-phosphatase